MHRSAILLAAAVILLAVHSTEAQSFDRAGVLQSITAARKPPALPLPPGAMAAPVSPESIIADQTARAAKEEDAAFKLLSTCEGRFGTLRRKLERQVSRAEWISTAGGLMGVIGAVATCPQCAAFAAGLAGLANPLQQTFKANADTPQDTQDMLNKLSAKIELELEAYRKLPAATPGDPAFESQLRSRLDSLFVVTASCTFYSTSMAGTSESPATPVATKP